MTWDDDLFGEFLDDDDEFLAQWAEADAQAAQVIARVLSDHRGLPPPAEIHRAASAVRSADDAYVTAAVRALSDVPEDPAALVVAVSASLLRMDDDPGLDVEEQAAVMSLDYVDLLGVTIEAVRRGPGTSLDPRRLPRLIEACPEVDGGFEPGDEGLIEVGFWPLINVWRRLGVVDRDHRLTPLGMWVLPRAISWAWGGDFDEPVGDTTPSGDL